MSDACQPIFRYGGCTSKPGVPDGTMIVLISPGPVRAVTVTKAVRSVPELVMKAFSPLTTHSPAAVVEHRRRARAAGVAARLGLGEAEAAEGAAGAEVGQPRLLLGLGAEAVDRVGAEAHARPRG